MIITHETTIEEYEAWLATNPDFSALKVAIRSTFRTIYKGISLMKRLVKKVKNASSLRGKITKHTCLRNPKAFLQPEFCRWLMRVSQELNRTIYYIQLLEREDRQREEKLALIEDEIAMEQLKIQALEILKNSTKSN